MVIKTMYFLRWEEALVRNIMYLSSSLITWLMTWCYFVKGALVTGHSAACIPKSLCHPVEALVGIAG